MVLHVLKCIKTLLAHFFVDAEIPSMPENALREAAVDYTVPVSEMADLLVRLCLQQVASSEVIMEENAENKKTEIEIRIAAEFSAFELGIMKFGEFSPYTCPACHGVLSTFKDGKRLRFRCHTGYVLSADSRLI